MHAFVLGSKLIMLLQEQQGAFSRAVVHLVFFLVFVLRARARRCTDRIERVRRATRVMALIVGCRQLSRFLRAACFAPDEYVRNPKSEHQQ